MFLLPFLCGWVNVWFCSALFDTFALPSCSGPRDLGLAALAHQKICLVMKVALVTFIHHDTPLSFVYIYQFNLIRCKSFPHMQMLIQYTVRWILESFLAEVLKFTINPSKHKTYRRITKTRVVIHIVGTRLGHCGSGMWWRGISWTTSTQTTTQYIAHLQDPPGFLSGTATILGQAPAQETPGLPVSQDPDPVQDRAAGVHVVVLDIFSISMVYNIYIYMYRYLV